jgi:uncharacterized protein (DUF2252 family)
VRRHAHPGNFGVFGTPERNLAFDVNDFDETLPGRWEWDVKRLAASVILAARNLSIENEEAASVAAGVIPSEARAPTPSGGAACLTPTPVQTVGVPRLPLPGRRRAGPS